MSIVIQKKLNKRIFHLNTRKLSEHERSDSLYQGYLSQFEDFELNFNESFLQCNLKGVKTALDALYKLLKNDELLITDLSKQEETLIKNSQDVFLIKRAGKVVKLLADYLVNKKNFVMKNSTMIGFLDGSSSENKEIIMMIVKILKVFAVVNSGFATILAHWPKLTETLLELTLENYKLYFKQVLCIVEAIIASNPSAITQNMYPLIEEILYEMPKKYFARFSRIIALIVLDNPNRSDFNELPSSFYEDKMVKIHSFLLCTPTLLDIYVTVLEHLKEIIQCLTSTSLENIKSAIEYLKESKLIRDSGLNLSFLKPLFEQCEVAESIMAEVFAPKFIVKFIVKKSNIAEILFIISNLLVSKRKFDVQEQLSQLNFFNRVIEPYFDLLFHPDLDLDTAEELSSSSDGYPRSPLTTTRIQLLRIIINFCDRDFSNFHNNDLLISNDEKSVLYNQIKKSSFVNLNDSNNSLEDPKTLQKILNKISFKALDEIGLLFDNGMNNAFGEVKTQGLLSKIINLFVKANGNSKYYFWLSSCIGSLVREFDCLQQVFIAHSGLLYHLLNQIMTNQISKSSNLQITYDLIGEIVKFNKYNIMLLENLCEKFGWTQLFVQEVEKNVVDSNVFLRAMILSAERFNYASEKLNCAQINGRAQVQNSSGILFTSMTENSLHYFKLLVEAINPESVNQDNICCVNTALVIAIFAEQKGTLQNYLSSLLSNDSIRTKSIIKVLEDFRKVLDIWQRYYLSKTKDSFNLQDTTMIQFVYFQNMAKKIQTFIKENTL